MSDSNKCFSPPVGMPEPGTNAKTSAGLGNWATVGLIACLCAVLTGCESVSTEPAPVFAEVALTPATATTPARFTSTTNYLQEGDVIGISFQYSTNFNTVQKIGLDGTLNLEGVGAVKAANKTILQLQGELAGLYQSQAKDDPILVRVISTTAVVYVSGAVNHPSRIPLERPLTVLEAIMEAGGFDTYRAKLSKVSVWRIENGRQRTYQLNLQGVFEGKDNSKPFYLQSGDVVFVAAKTFNF